MRENSDIAGIAAVIGDPARANMLTALMAGGALTASELTVEAGVTKQTTSAHLTRLRDAGLVSVEKQGRHRYYRLAGADIAALLENLMGIAAKHRPPRVRTGPKEPALRQARVCYDHLAGDRGVALFDACVAAKWLSLADGQPFPTDAGRTFFTDFGIDLAALEARRRPLCRACLDWSVRRSHLAGALGAALLTRFYDLGWAKRVAGTRVVSISRGGERALRETFGLVS